MALLFMYVVMKVKWQRMFIKRLKCVNQRANLSETDAEEYLKQMKRDKRYQRDVY